MLEKVLTAENHVEIFDRASRKSTREIAAISVESNAPVPAKAVLRMIPRPALRTPAAPLDPTIVALDPTAVAIATPTTTAREHDETIAPAIATAIETASNEPGPRPVRAPGPAASPKQRVVQVSPRQFKLTLVVGAEFKAKVDRVKKILSHRIPDGNLETVLAAALDLVIAKDDNRRGPPTTKKGGTGEATAARSASKPTARGIRARATPASAVDDLRVAAESGEAVDVEFGASVGDATMSPADSTAAMERSAHAAVPSVERGEFARGVREHIPAEVARALWERDGGKCCWVLASGEICGSEFQVQHDHEIPVAQGGRSILSNLRLLCAPHNLLAARRELGEALMAKYRKRG